MAGNTKTEKVSANNGRFGARPRPANAGRKKGTPNKATREAKEFAALVVDDPAYRAKLLARARKGSIAPAVEVMLWHYAKGKPVERHEHSLTVSFAELVAASQQAAQGGI